jgi:CHAT domain
MSSTIVMKILILAANPKNSSELRLGEEAREIDEGLRRSRNRDQFELISKWAVRPRDFYRYMLDVSPQIIHFSGHGVGEDGIALEDDAGKVQLVSTDALESLFKLFANKGVECVVLNACLSEVQAEAISHHIPYVIGMHQEIKDRAAIAFAVAFYDALGSGETPIFAFELACTAIQMLGSSGYLTPALYVKKHIA